jgi:alpha-beta hydrolase superfamily lysophospholipase
MRRLIRHLLRAIGYGLIGSLLVLVGGYVWLQEQRPDLMPWHKAVLDAEFRAADAAGYRGFDDYLQQEERLFGQLQHEVYDRVETTEQTPFNRYATNSLLNPQNHRQNWNRTFVLEPERPVGGVLMLHGLSDSPYSMRALGERLAGQGLLVIGLRLPGHGTAPSALLDMTWQDQAAAVRLAMAELRRRLDPSRPLYIAGYSNGAALAVEYALSVLEGEALPAVDALVLLSPAIGVSPVAALAIWQSRLSWLFGLKKLAWTDLALEIDPYKYNSFTVNAGDQIFRLTGNIAARIGKLADSGALGRFPRTIAFQSVVDATIPPATLIDQLFMQLGRGYHELVLFDVNRHAESTSLMRADPESLTARLLREPELPFDITVLTNVSVESDTVVARRKAAGATSGEASPTDLVWPQGLFSLSHVAIPFPPDDPVYGGVFDHPGGERQITLGSVSIRGERNLLQIPDNYFLRLRYNPFFEFLVARSLEFLDLAK